MIEARLSNASKTIGPAYSELAGMLVQRKANRTLLLQIAETLRVGADILQSVAESLPERPAVPHEA